MSRDMHELPGKKKGSDSIVQTPLKSVHSIIAVKIYFISSTYNTTSRVIE